MRKLGRRKPNWHERYIAGDPPWDTGRHDFNLSEVVTKRQIQPCKTLEIGCGTGSNAIWLSRKGFSVTAVDVTEIAIQQAIEKASKAGVRCKFFVKDFMKQKIDAVPFGFVGGRAARCGAYDGDISAAPLGRVLQQYVVGNAPIAELSRAVHSHQSVSIAGE